MNLFSHVTNQFLKSFALVLLLGSAALTTYAADTKSVQESVKGKSPYTLEQIEAHLTEMYRFDIEEGNGLKRWDDCSVNYVISTISMLTDAETKIVRDMMKKYSNVVNVKVFENTKQKCNVGLIYTDDFLKTLKLPAVRKRLLPGYTDSEFLGVYKQFKETGDTSYGVLYAIKSKKINRMYILSEVNEERRKYFKRWSELGAFERFSLRENSGKSNKIVPSIVNFGKDYAKEPVGILQPIDRYYLEALYSNRVYYGMPIEKAITIMSQYIHQKLGG